MKILFTLLLSALSAFASTITGPVGDLSGAAFNPRVEFWPLSTPFNIGNTNIVGPPKTVPVVNGNFSQVLVAGRYLVKFPPTTNSFYIHVPNDTSTYSLAAVSTNVSSVTGIASAPVYRVKVTSADTNAGFLSSKLVAGSGVTITTNSAGQDETLTITAAVGSTYTNNTGLPGVVLGSGIGTNLATLATSAALVAADTVVSNGIVTRLAAGSYAMNNAFNILDFGAIPNDLLDDAPAFQAAVNYAHANEKEITVMIPDGIYLWLTNFTACQDVALAAYAQITIPARSYNSQRTVGVNFVGMTQPTFNMQWSTNQQPITTNGAIIISTNATGFAGNTLNTNTAAIGLPSLASYPWGYTAFRIGLKNLTFRGKNQPAYSMIDGKGIGQLTLENVEINVGVPLSDILVPTNYVNVVAVRLPNYANWTECIVQHVMISGYPRGLSFGEHTMVHWLQIQNCITATEIVAGGGSGYAGHASFLGYTLFQSCQTNIAVIGAAGSGVKVAWSLFSSEHNPSLYIQPSWSIFYADIHDPDNVLRGSIEFSSLNSGGTEANWIPSTGTYYNNTNVNIVGLYSPEILLRKSGANTTSGKIAFGGEDANIGAPLLTFYTPATFGGPVMVQRYPAGGIVYRDFAGTTWSTLTSTGLVLNAAGSGLYYKEGSNCRMGTTTLNGATSVTVSTTKVTATSRIFLTIQVPGGTPGIAYVHTRTAGTSFEIRSTAGDTSTIAWFIVEPAP